jgi:GNAT superfamily N-acetyltransferase
VTVVRGLEPTDTEWLKRVWTSVEADIGSWFVVGARAWYVYQKARTSTPHKVAREHWVGVEGAAFAHYRVRARDGVAVLGEIGVLPAARRQGFARALVGSMPRPLELKTDATNLASNAFYVSLGGVLMGRARAKSDQRRALCCYLFP